MTYTCNLSLWETEAGESPALGNWGYTARPSLTTEQIPSEVQTRGGALKWMASSLQVTLKLS